MTITNLNDLGLFAPRLGPWFSTANIALATPGAAMDITIAGQGQTYQFRPPLPGLLSYAHWTAGNTPAVATRFRNVQGTAAFATPAMVALFQILPEVQARLARLMRQLPLLVAGDALPDAQTSARTPPAWFALELRGMAVGAVRTAVDPVLPNARPLTDLGIGVNEPPIKDLKRPGMTLNQSEALLTVPTNQAAQLWCFDAHYQPIDPGAVAAWLGFLAAAHNDLWATGVTGADQRTAPIAPNTAPLTLHITTPAEGTVGAAEVGRVTRDNNVTAIDAGNRLLSLNMGQNNTTLTLTTPNGGTPLRIAPLPHGPYRAGPLTVTRDNTLARDYLRLGLVDLELWLTGQPRTAGNNASAAVQARAAMQGRASTRIRVAPANVGRLHATSRGSATALTNVISNQAGARLACGPVDPAWGTPPDPYDTTSVNYPPFPTQLTLPERINDLDSDTANASYLSVVALSGSGQLENDVIKNQSVVLRLKVNGTANGQPTPLSGAVAQLWTNTVDTVTGRRLRKPAAAGKVDATGELLLLVPLPDGQPFDADTGRGKMRVDLVLRTGNDMRRYFDLRFDRPDVIAGDAKTRATMAAGDSYVLPEMGMTLVALQQNVHRTAWLPSGQSIFVRNGAAFSLFDRDSLTQADYAGGTLANAMGANAVIDSAGPAFALSPDGQASTAAAQFGGTLRAHDPAGFLRPTQAEGPLEGQDRLTTLASTEAAATAQSVLHAAPTLDDLHEGRPHNLAHPGTKSTTEIHGVGLSIDGPAARIFAEVTHAQSSTGTADLATRIDARPAAPATPAGARIWAAPLETTARGVAGESALGDTFFNGFNATPYTYGGTLAQAAQFAGNISAQTQTTIQGLNTNPAAVLRALERRFHKTQYGAREGLVALHAAIGRAETLIYLETPCLEDVAVGPDGDKLNIVGALQTRLASHPALHLVICTSARYSPFLPKRPAQLRRERTRAAIDKLSAAAPGRVSAFVTSAGPHRSLRLASSVAVIDDAFVLLGRTHFWRRGLSFDASLSAAVFDEALSQGRPAALRAFRTALLAGRLGVNAAAIPVAGDDLANAITQLVARGGLGRLSTQDLAVRDFNMTDPEAQFWNPDGSTYGATLLNPTSWFDTLNAIVGGVLANATEATSKAESER